jgi:hypothetical protein
MRYLSIALVLVLALAMGCAKTMEGKKFDGSKTKDLLAAGTNGNKVIQMFGEPQQKEQLASGETKYIYYYRERRPFWWGEPKDQQRLEVFLKNNRVDRYRYVYTEQEPITKDIPPIQPEKK